MALPFRVGHGLDVHRWTEGRPLKLGGVAIPHSQGLLGHSDADVLLHAIIDALLGAARLGDIGQHFPDRDPAYQDIDSRLLLEQVRKALKARGWRVVNVDATVVCQQPKLAPHRRAMEKSIAKSLRVWPDRINVKATTTEGLGFTGRDEGVAAMAVALLERRLTGKKK